MDNKTKTLTKILKTTQSEINSTSQHFTKNVQGSFTCRLLDRPTHSQIRRENTSEIFDKRKRWKNTYENREIQEQNMRLVSRIFQIKRKRSSFEKQSPSLMRKSRENPQKSWQIKQQNKRLGDSLIKIHTGKSAQRIKTEINQKVQRMLRKKLAKEQKAQYKLFLQQKKSFIFPQFLQPSSKLNDRYRL